MTTVITANDVNQALPQASVKFLHDGIRQESRNGKVLVMPGVFVTALEFPRDRVLFYPERDANPFFHLMEALWMLAGRNDVYFPSSFNSTIGDYSDDGIRFYGAYGYRWRKWFEHDQIETVIRELRSDQWSRRAVIQMYDARHDHSIMERGGKDIPCNLSISFHETDDGLDMTVFNRSNDLIWGAYGANVVHFSMLHEIIALACGFSIGRYHQVSSNTHVYEKHWPLLTALSKMKTVLEPYTYGEVYACPLLKDEEVWTDFIYDCESLCNLRETDAEIRNFPFKTYFFKRVVVPMYLAWFAYKSHNKEVGLAHLTIQDVSIDWIAAGVAWLKRRK